MFTLSRKSIFVRDFYYDVTNDIFIREEHYIPVELRKVLKTYKFSIPNFASRTIKVEKNNPPLAFCTTPETLLNIAVSYVDSIPLPMVYTWNIEDVCRWLREYGYPQYQQAFRLNMINGRTLLLIDASALTAMNIKNFDHIRHITYGIRCLFGFEMAKFARSISLPPEDLGELYKLFRVRTGRIYESSRASDFWHRIQVLRKNNGGGDHWEILQRWLEIEHNVVERVGDMHRYEMYKSRKKTEEKKVEKVEDEDGEVDSLTDEKPCLCMPPCECHWTERKTRPPRKLSMLSETVCEKSEKVQAVLSLLVREFPERYKRGTIVQH